MARMHSRRRGKSGSTKPLRTEPPDWVTIPQKEIVDIIVKLAKAGTSSAKIGLVLRDQYGIPSVRLVMGKSLLKIIKENEVMPKIPEDLSSLMKKAVNLSRHLQKMPKDLHNKRNLYLIEAKIRRLVKYYHRMDRLDKSWLYSLDNAKLLVE
jgi:small subunit ribosomal protein S15